MATYLCMRVNNSVKSYEAKTLSEVGKTYLRVPGGYFPLTTDTGTGLKIRSAGSNYRIVESYTTTISVNTSSTNTYTYESTESDSLSNVQTQQQQSGYFSFNGSTTQSTYTTLRTNRSSTESYVWCRKIYHDLENYAYQVPEYSITHYAYQVFTSDPNNSLIIYNSTFNTSFDTSISNNSYFMRINQAQAFSAYYYFSININGSSESREITNSRLVNSTYKTSIISKEYTIQDSQTSRQDTSRYVIVPKQFYMSLSDYVQMTYTLKTYSTIYYSYTNNDKTSTSYYTTESTVTSQ